jgi:sulfoxide reductase heme-binding subunit YedZ
MSEMRNTQPHDNSILTGALWLVGGMLFLVGLLMAVLAAQLPVFGSLGRSLSWLFAADSVQVMWYITRAAGMTSYLLLWLSVVLGLAVSSKIFDILLHRSFTYDFHEFLSLAALGFVALHMGVLFFDRYMPYSLAEVLVPFVSSYRPFWVGMGVIGMYLSVLVTVTFYLRTKIGMKTFRRLHVLSLVAYLGVTLHGLFAGTDSSLAPVLGIYAGTFLTVVFLGSFWIYQVSLKNHQKLEERPQAARTAGK